MSPFCECGEGAGGEMGHLVRKWGSVGGFWGGNGGGSWFGLWERSEV